MTETGVEQIANKPSEGIHLKEWVREAYWQGSERARKESEIALTFDDGFSARTIDILDILNANHVKATFFVFSDELEAFSDADPGLFSQTMEAVERGGHEIALHGDCPYDIKGIKERIFGAISPDRLVGAKNKLEKLTGQKIKLYRPHNWQLGPSIAVAKSYEMDTVMLSKEVGVNAKSSSVKQVVKISERAKPGNIIDIHERQAIFDENYISELDREVPEELVNIVRQKEQELGRQLTGGELVAILEGAHKEETREVVKKEVTSPVEIVGALIHNLKAKGLKFVTASEIIKE